MILFLVRKLFLQNHPLIVIQLKNRNIVVINGNKCIKGIGKD